MNKISKRGTFKDQEKINVENRAIALVETAAEALFAKYRTLDGAFGGRYVNSDLFKEVFDDYNASPAHRTCYNTAVHNAAAVLADELFHRMVAKPDTRKTVLFITGIPGAGKTTAIQENEDIRFDKYRVVYEGQLASPEQAREKIDWCLGHKCNVIVFVFHRKPAQALEHTFCRFNKCGRGASVQAMSNIQGGLAKSMPVLMAEYEANANVTFCVIDLDKGDCLPVCDDITLFNSVLTKEGDTNAIRTTLEQRLEQARNDGRISDACYQQAKGREAYELSRLQELYVRASEDNKKTS